jgi:hypothetical protein
MNKSALRSLAGFAAMCMGLTVACAGSVQGQENAKPSWTLITIFKIRPEMRSEFESMQKEISAAYKQAGAGSRTVWQDFLGDANTYTAVTSIPNFAAFDGPMPLNKALGQDRADALRKRLSSTITDLRRMVVENKMDLSMVGESYQPLPYAVVAEARALPNRDKEYEGWIKQEFLPAMKQGGIKELYTMRVVFGATGGDYVMVVPVPNMAAIDQGHPAWKMEGGRAAAEKMFARGHDLSEPGEVSIVRYMPEASYVAAPMTAAK